MLSLGAFLEVVVIVVAVNTLLLLAGLAVGRRMLRRTMGGMTMPRPAPARAKEATR